MIKPRLGDWFGKKAGQFQQGKLRVFKAQSGRFPQAGGKPRQSLRAVRQAANGLHLPLRRVNSLVRVGSVTVDNPVYIVAGVLNNLDRKSTRLNSSHT